MRVRSRHRDRWWCQKCHRPLRRVGPEAYRSDHLGFGGHRGHWDVPVSIRTCGKKKGVPQAPLTDLFPARPPDVRAVVLLAVASILHIVARAWRGCAGLLQGTSLVVTGVGSGIVYWRRMDPPGNLIENPVGDHAPREGVDHWSPSSGKETRCEDRRNRWHRVEFAEPVDTHPWPPWVETSRER